MLRLLTCACLIGCLIAPGTAARADDCPLGTIKVVIDGHPVCRPDGRDR